jgi:hypothetical protein
MKKKPLDLSNNPVWNTEKIKETTKVLKTAKSFPEAARILKENCELIERITYKYKIPHPCMKWGGARRGNKFLEKDKRLTSNIKKSDIIV